MERLLPIFQTQVSHTDKQLLMLLNKPQVDHQNSPKEPTLPQTTELPPLSPEPTAEDNQYNTPFSQPPVHHTPQLQYLTLLKAVLQLPTLTLLPHQDMRPLPTPLNKTQLENGSPM